MKKTTDTQPKQPLVKRATALALALLACTALLLTACNDAAASSSQPQPAQSSSLPVVSSSSEPEPPPPPQPTEARVRFSAVGDNLIHSSLYNQANERAGGTGYDFNYLYENVKYFFEDYDVNWINQETLVNNELPPATYPCFSTPGELGQAAYDAGWRVFATSNNHSYDMGAKGIAATRRYWAEMPDDVVTFGFYTDRQSADGIALQQVNDLTIAYVAFTGGTNGIPTPGNAEAFVIYTSETEAMQSLVTQARELADVVVVGVHWGVEYSHTPTDGQRNLAAKFAEWGADVIIGTHPHVIQPVEWLTNEADGRQVLVAYSLGNFASAQDRAPRMVGLCLAFDLVQVIEPDGLRHPLEIQNAKVYPTVTHYDGGFKNNRNYMFRDYTPELAAAHGVRAKDADFSVEYITNLVQQYISPDFLVLD